MYIEDGTLLKIDETDIVDGKLILPEGIVRIPSGTGHNLNNLRELYFPDSLRTLSPDAFADAKNIHILRLVTGWLSYQPSMMCPSSKPSTIIHGNASYAIEFHDNMSFYIERTRHIAGIGIKYARRTKFDDTGICGTSWYILRGNGFSIADNNIQRAINVLRTKIEIQKFDAELETYGDTDKKILGILKDAFSNTVKACQSQPRQSTSLFDQYRREIPDVIRELKVHALAYGLPSINYEYQGINWAQLKRVIAKLPAQQSYSIFKKLKRQPVANFQLNLMMLDKSIKRTPGAFPVEWLKHIDKADIGKATQKLHRILRDYSILLYDKERPVRTDFYDKLSDMADDMSRVLNTDVAASRLGYGQFGKTIKISVNDYACVWKIYHSDNTQGYLEYNNHDTEPQDSFLVSGKRHHGRQRYNKIYTARLSPKRAEKYILYPFVPQAFQQIKEDPFETCKSFYSNDTKEDNFVGNTLVDMGLICKNMAHYQYPYFTKVVNSILFQDWEAMVFVLHNHSKDEIRKVLIFLDDKLKNKKERNTPNLKIIRAKMEFLQNKTR